MNYLKTEDFVFGEFSIYFLAKIGTNLESHSPTSGL